MSKSSFLTLLFFSLCFIIIIFSHAQNNGFSVELIHRDSSKSPLYKPTQNKYQHFINAARRSINIANHFYKDSLANTPQSTVFPDKGDYLMTYSVGTPPFKLYGLVDTGSDIVWFQCVSCKQCYNQTTPMFNPSKSSSYKNIPCSSNLCQSVRDTSCNDQNSCEYSVFYAGNSHSQGDLSVDTLTLESTTGLTISFPKIMIGCGANNAVSLDGPASGIVGFGGGPVSFISQLGSQIDDKFSYCFTPLSFVTNIASNTTSKLNFGDAAIVSGDGVVTTPIVKKDQITLYYLTLEALSVGNKSIEFGRHASGVNEGNIMIDTGSTLTILPNDVYTNLESAVVDLVKLKRIEDPNTSLSLCYNATLDVYDFPIITAHFKGADVILHPISTFIPVSDGAVCFAFASSQTYVIFGNLAQQNLLVGYDLKQKLVSFKPTDCTKV